MKAGEPIGAVETTDAEIAVHNAEGALAQAQAELANILYGRRPEEIAAIEATLDAAKVQTEDNKRSLERGATSMRAASRPRPISTGADRL